MGTVIDIRDISKEYHAGVKATKVLALEHLDLSIQAGEVFGFLGPNGAGKSTTIKILMNLIFPSSGQAFIQDKDVHDPAARKSVGFLPENPFYYDHLTAVESLRFAAVTSGFDRRHADQAAKAILEKLDLPILEKRPLRTYSKGMLQRVGLALALVHDPEVVILDEPMSGLDPIGRKLVCDLILEMKSRGKTVFFSSHILSDIERLCDRVGIIVNCRLQLVQSLTDLLAGTEGLEQVFLKEVEKNKGVMAR